MTYIEFIPVYLDMILYTFGQKNASTNFPNLSSPAKEKSTNRTRARKASVKYENDDNS